MSFDALPNMGFSKPILKQGIWSPSREQLAPVPPETFRLHYDRARSMCREIGRNPRPVNYAAAFAKH